MNRIPKDKSLMKTISWKTKGGDYKFIKVKIQDVWFFIDSWSWKENDLKDENRKTKWNGKRLKKTHHMEEIQVMEEEIWFTSRPGNKVYNLEFFFPFSSRICDAEIFPLYHRNEFTNVQVIHCWDGSSSTDGSCEISVSRS